MDDVTKQRKQIGKPFTSGRVKTGGNARSLFNRDSGLHLQPERRSRQRARRIAANMEKLLTRNEARRISVKWRSC